MTASTKPKRLSKGKVEYQGQVWCTVAETARILGTTATKVRGLMGEGKLDWQQFRVNGPLYVLLNSVLDYDRRK